VRNFVFNGTLKPNAGVEKLFTTAINMNIPLMAAHAARELPVDSKTNIHFIFPFDEDSEGLTIEKNQNKHSLVFIVDMYTSRFLFTGDMEKNSEANVLEYYKNNSDGLLPIDVLKVAHHGSKTSTTDEWLEFWLPKLAVISVGEHNTYGHPTEEVLSRLKEHEVQVYRTDEQGEVDMLIKEDGIHTRVKLLDNF
jgi:competence protein ComEC